MKEFLETISELRSVWIFKKNHNKLASCVSDRADGSKPNQTNYIMCYLSVILEEVFSILYNMHVILINISTKIYNVKILFKYYIVSS